MARACSFGCCNWVLGAFSEESTQHSTGQKLCFRTPLLRYKRRCEQRRDLSGHCLLRHFALRNVTACLQEEKYQSFGNEATGHQVACKLYLFSNSRAQALQLNSRYHVLKLPALFPRCIPVGTMAYSKVCDDHGSLRESSVVYAGEVCWTVPTGGAQQTYLLLSAMFVPSTAFGADRVIPDATAKSPHQLLRRSLCV